MKRVLEPEVMDTPEEARDYNAMDHSAVNAIFVDDLLAKGLPGNKVLDLGTGTALIPILLCQSHEEARILAVDAATHMLDLARLNVGMANLHLRIQLQQVDAKNLPFPEGMFDATISNSIIHHIPEPQQCLREAIRVTRPGGLLFFRDLLRPPSQTGLESLVEQYAGHESEHARRLFAESLGAALSLDEIRDMVHGLGFSAESVKPTSDRHWTWSVVRAA
jgi:ubiquinone/menaquinone biosynthesis C-methylase UbiE